MFSTSVVAFTRYEVAVELLLVLMSAASVHPYTVEDVYKRQVRDNVMRTDTLGSDNQVQSTLIRVPDSKVYAWNAGAVSYTHLDVYKRQTVARRRSGQNAVWHCLRRGCGLYGRNALRHACCCNQL